MLPKPLGEGAPVTERHEVSLWNGMEKREKTDENAGWMKLMWWEEEEEGGEEKEGGAESRRRRRTMDHLRSGS